MRAAQTRLVTLWHSPFPFSLSLRGWHRCVCTWLQPTELRQHRVPVEMLELPLPPGQAATVLWSFDLSKSLTWARVGPCQPRGHTKAPIVAPARAGGEQEEPRRALTAALSSRSRLRFPPPEEPFGCEGWVFMCHGHTFRFPRCAWSRDHAQCVRGQEAEQQQQPDPRLKCRMEGGDGASRAAPAVSIPCSSSIPCPCSEYSLFLQ